MKGKYLMRKAIVICVVAATVFVAGCDGNTVRYDRGDYAAEKCSPHGGVRAHTDTDGSIGYFTCIDGSSGWVDGDYDAKFYPFTPTTKGW